MLKIAYTGWGKSSSVFRREGYGQMKAYRSVALLVIVVMALSVSCTTSQPITKENVSSVAALMQWEDVYDATFNSDGSKLALVGGNGVQILKVSTGKTLQVLTIEAANRVAFHPNDSVLATASNLSTDFYGSAVLFWDLDTGDVLHGFDTTPYFVIDMAFSPDGETLAVLCGGGLSSSGVILIDVGDNEVLGTIQPDSVQSIDFNSDGSQLVASDKVIRLYFKQSAKGDYQGGDYYFYSADNPTNIMTTFFINAVAFSPDDSAIVYGGWASQLGGEGFKFLGRLILESDGSLLQRDTCKSLAFSALSIAVSSDGSLLAAGGSEDGMIYLYDTVALSDCEILHVLEGHNDKVDSIEFSPEGTRLVTTSYGGMAILWGSTP